MSDEIDRANDLVQQVRDAGIAGVCAAALALAQPSGVTHCEGCSQPIPLGRIEAVPAARHCVRCASEGRP